MVVPNKFPVYQSPYRLALVGEAPGVDEEREGIPFIGNSGRFLNALLSRAGIQRDACFVGNICQVRPEGNEIARFDWNGPEIQLGIERLTEDLHTFKPNIVVGLGNTALHFLMHGNTYVKRTVAKGKPTFRWPSKISNWRGSLFQSQLGFKATASYHPAFVLAKDYDTLPFLMLDLRRAVVESSKPELVLPVRTVTIARTPLEVKDFFDSLDGTVGTDLEGYWNDLRCIGFAPTKDHAFIVPFVLNNGSSYWSPHDEPHVWRLLAQALENPSWGKIWQNGLYDRFVLHYGHHIRVANNVDDIMLKHWSLYSELGQDDQRRKGKRGMGLDIQASIYTREPYWKNQRDDESDQVTWEYCGKDCCTTKEISDTLDDIFRGENFDPTRGFTKPEFEKMRTLYTRLNGELCPLLYMEVKGIRYDVQGAKERRDLLRHKMFELQARLNALTGYGFTWQNTNELTDRAYQLMAFKKANAARVSTPK